MRHFGKITHFDKQTGTGMISPLDGGNPVQFMASGMPEEPRSDQTYAFETQTGADGVRQAVNLQMEDGPQAQQQFGGAPGAQGESGGFGQQGESDERHNQEAARRSGVDGAGLGGAGAGYAGAGQQDQSQSPYQAEHQTRTGQDGVSRGGTETARGDTRGDIRADRGGTAGGGSTFQPLESEESKAHRSPEEQHRLGRDAQGHDEREQDRRAQDRWDQNDRRP